MIVELVNRCARKPRESLSVKCRRCNHDQTITADATVVRCSSCGHIWERPEGFEAITRGKP